MFVQALCSEFDFSITLAQLLVSRNLTSAQRVREYLEPNPEQCHDPFLMHDMDKAVDRIHRALKQGENVVLYGDYDVDGTAGAVMAYRFLQRLGMRVQYFIPKRLKDGYGLTETTLRELKSRNTQLIITIDNGARAVEEARIAKNLGIDLLVTDHHPPGDVLSDTVSMVNPLKTECQYPFSGLSGTGVIFKLLTALDTRLEQTGFWSGTGHVRADLRQELDLVALATIADRMPLVDENRYLVKHGLELMNPCSKPGIQALLKACGVRGQVTPSVISYKLAPKINAVGRLDDPLLAVKLLLSHSLAEARPYAERLVKLNERRQKIEGKVLEDALAQASSQQHRTALILVDRNWHPGVMGNIAAKVSRRFGKTTLALTFKNSYSSQHGKNPELAVGSARSVGDLDLCRLLQDCGDMLVRFGGHPAAVGMSLCPENLELFCTRFHQLIEGHSMSEKDQHPESTGKLHIDAWLTPEQLQPELGRELMRMSPFGMENPPPVLGIRNSRPHTPVIFGKKHLKFRLGPKNRSAEIVAWDRSNWFQWMGQKADLAISPQIYGRNAHEMRIQYSALDIKPHFRKKSAC